MSTWGDLGETLENLDVSVAQSWAERCTSEGLELWDNPEEPESWVRGWELSGERFVNRTFFTVKLLPPGGMHHVDLRAFPPRIEDRPTLRDVTFERCTISNKHWTGDAAVLDEVTFTDLKGDLSLELCALRHVTLIGRFPTIHVNRSTDIDLQSGRPHRLKHVDRVLEQNDRFHDEADWVLDISQAHSREFDVRGLPTEKIRVDPSRQAFVTAESLKPGRAQIEALGDEPSFVWHLRRVLDGKRPGLYLAHTTPRGKDLAAELAAIELLTTEGLTLPTAPPPDPT